MIKRPLYLDKIKPYIDQDFIKILVGVRRAGKSTILSQIEAELKQRGIPAEKIVHINFDSLEYAEIRTRHEFLELVKNLSGSGVKYFFLDEIQLIEQWDEIISALYAEKKSDIYISGSNSKLLSSELSTYLTGRYINNRISTLNFAEFLDFKVAKGESIQDISTSFDEYLRRGGFPAVNAGDNTYEQGDHIVADIYASIVLRDIVQRKNVRNTELLTRIVKFIFDNISNVFSANSLTAFLKNEKRSIAPETIYNYLDWLAEAFVVDKVPRYDLRGKAILKTQEKYYLGDISLLYAVNGRGNFESYLPGLLENVVYHELICKGYKVKIGKNGDRKIDFVASRPDRTLYLQVATHLEGADTIEREFSAFAGLDDEDAEKYVLSLDKNSRLKKYGAKQAYLPDFILNL